MGPPGPPGETGPKGKTGLTGKTGRTGKTGPKGIRVPLILPRKMMLFLRMVPPFATAYTFYAFRDGPRNSNFESNRGAGQKERSP